MSNYFLKATQIFMYFCFGLVFERKLISHKKKGNMLKKIFFLLILVSSIGNAQHTIKGEMKPVGNFEWIVMYQLQGAKQKYIVDTKVKDGKFTINIPINTKPGVYRLIYNLERRLFVNVIYNNEDIAFTLNPDFPSETVEFISSDENKIPN